MGAFETVTQFGRMLGNLDAWLEKGVAYAQEKGFHADVLATARLAPDQYSLVQQVQGASDQAKFAAAYLSGQKAPSHPDTETTIAELRARVATCLAYVKGFKAADFTGAEERRVEHGVLDEPAHLPMRGMLERHRRLQHDAVPRQRACVVADEHRAALARHVHDVARDHAEPALVHGLEERPVARLGSPGVPPNIRPPTLGDVRADESMPEVARSVVAPSRSAARRSKTRPRSDPR